MVTDGPDLEMITVGGEQRVLYLKQETEDPDVAALSLTQARSKLADALQNIKELRLAQEAAHPPEALAEAPQLGAGQPRLALDEFEHTDFTQRPHLPFEGIATGPTDRPAAAAPPISSILSPITLDALTVADDPGYLDRVAAQGAPHGNLPAGLAPALHALYQG
jgi:5-methylthioadenosine/S-adenosylhomocysteine deaminase